MFGAIPFDPVLHEILPGCDFARSARSELNDPDLLVYRHRRTKNFVLASKVKLPGGEDGLLEHFILGSTPVGTREMLTKLKRRRETGNQDVKRRNIALLKGDNARHMNQLQEDNDTEMDLKRFFKRKLTRLGRRNIADSPLMWNPPAKAIRS